MKVLDIHFKISKENLTATVSWNENGARAVLSHTNIIAAWTDFTTKVDQAGRRKLENIRQEKHNILKIWDFEFKISEENMTATVSWNDNGARATRSHTNIIAAWTDFMTKVDQAGRRKLGNILRENHLDPYTGTKPCEAPQLRHTKAPAGTDAIDCKQCAYGENGKDTCPAQSGNSSCINGIPLDASSDNSPSATVNGTPNTPDNPNATSTPIATDNPKE